MDPDPDPDEEPEVDPPEVDEEELDEDESLLVVPAVLAGADDVADERLSVR